MGSAISCNVGGIFGKFLGKLYVRSDDGHDPSSEVPFVKYLAYRRGAEDCP